MNQIVVNFSGEDFTFNTGPKLFSPNKLDNGSRLLLENLKLDKPPTSIVDIGCGYGVMGIILAKLNPDSQVLLIDNDPVAFDTTKQNILLNNVTNAKAFKGDVTRSVVNRTFDLVVTNPPWSKNNSVIPQIVQFSFYNLDLGGEFFMVINQTFKSEDRIEKYFLNVETVAARAPYKLLHATKKFTSWSKTQL